MPAFPQRGPAASWTGAGAERRALYPKMWGFVWQGRAYEGLTCNALEWVASQGRGRVVDADGKISIDHPSAARALSMAASWVGKIAPKAVLNYGWRQRGSRQVDASVVTCSDAGVEVAIDGTGWHAPVSAGQLRVGDHVTLGVRSEHVVLGEGPQRARVSHLEQLGELTQVYLEFEGTDTPVLANTRRDDIRRGETLDFQFESAALHLFESTGKALVRLPR